MRTHLVPVVKTRSGRRYAVEPEDQEWFAAIIRHHGVGNVAKVPSWRADPCRPEPDGDVDRRNMLEETFGWGGFAARWIRSGNHVDEMLRNLSIDEVVKITTTRVTY